jgi:electron-transferring-flavoprotein dehydrogenase
MEERELMEVDVLFVGGGIANLSGALHLANLIQQHNEKVQQSGEGDPLDEVMIAVLEKGAYVGAHAISGAVMDPVALAQLVPDYIEKEAPLEARVQSEKLLFLTRKGKIGFPGPLLSFYNPMDNHGNFVVSLSKLAEWLGNQAEEAGVDIFPEFAGTEILYDQDRVIGVRTGDKGVDADGTQKPNFEPGIDLHAKVTVLGEGSRGSLTKTLIRRFQLDQDCNPDGYAVGVKEVWELPEGRIQPGEVIHTMGYPHDRRTYGGGFIYGMQDNQVAIGLLTGLEYQDPCKDPHRDFQKFKSHPFMVELLKDGKIIQYGAKTAPQGGYFSIPKLVVDGGMIVGDAGALFISNKIKGVHAAMLSGMLAAETILQGLLNQDFSAAQLDSYPAALMKSGVGKELYKARNYHQAFHRGLYTGMVKIGLQYLLGGRILKPRLMSKPDFSCLKSVQAYYGSDDPSDEQKGDVKYDGTLSFDKETDLFYSGTVHEEKQPAHLQIVDLQVCYDQCRETYQNPCIRFCPANVYEMNIDEKSGEPKMVVNFSNCLHCKTCDVKDPYENIIWVPPEGGGGPKFTTM